ncbi:unnamed protein product [Chrysodeixis includens]|uniref:Protein quiver n=1 Tax=Chrysodeixis includens TaxID=689277 RepID=A0A9N8KYC0_CHRIL|nr:unnamed protein product [Chrysodeixis includens]
MIVLVFCLAGLLPYVLSESCFYQRCLGCRPEQMMIGHGEPVECHPNNWVSPQWLHSYGQSYIPPSTDSRIPIEYRCIKMTATPDDKTFGNTIDVLRGCIPRAQVDITCLGLESIQRARGHSDARCFVCKGNNCNAAPQTHTLPLKVAIISFLTYLVIR